MSRKGRKADVYTTIIYFKHKEFLRPVCSPRFTSPFTIIFRSLKLPKLILQLVKFEDLFSKVSIIHGSIVAAVWPAKGTISDPR